jgi:hypothetical protein
MEILEYAALLVSAIFVIIVLANIANITGRKLGTRFVLRNYQRKARKLRKDGECYTASIRNQTKSKNLQSQEFRLDEFRTRVISLNFKCRIEYSESAYLLLNEFRELLEDDPERRIALDPETMKRALDIIDEEAAYDSTRRM